MPHICTLAHQRRFYLLINHLEAGSINRQSASTLQIPSIFDILSGISDADHFTTITSVSREVYRVDLSIDASDSYLTRSKRLEDVMHKVAQTCRII